MRTSSRGKCSTILLESNCSKILKQTLLWLPVKGRHIVFTWPFLHFLTLQPAVAIKRLFQFKSNLEFKCVSHLGLHLGRPSFPQQPPT